MFLGDYQRFDFSNDGFLILLEMSSFHDYAGKKQSEIIHLNGIKRLYFLIFDNRILL